MHRLARNSANISMQSPSTARFAISGQVPSNSVRLKFDLSFVIFPDAQILD